MVVCKFWLQGNCRKGNSCNFEHPSNVRQNNNNNSSGFRGAGGLFGAISQSERWQLNDTEIRNELTDTRPKWILSGYGPTKDLPAALFVENEYSPEEIRWRFYQQDSVGNGAVADQEAQQLWQKAANEMSNVAQNAKDVQKFMEEKERVHPNRYDLCKMDGTIPRADFDKKMGGNSTTTTSSSPFGSGQTTSPFSRPAASSSPFGQTASPFGQAAQSSPFGQSAKPSPFGQPAPASAFGQPAQPSAFGQPAQPSAFGRPTQPSAFGKPAFGQSSTPAQPAFGQTSTPSQPAFGQTGFGQNTASQTTSRFGGPIANQSPFGGAASQQTSAFGQPSTLGQNSAAPATSAAPGFGAGTGFGQPAQPGAFGRPAFGSTATPSTSSPFGAGKISSPFGAPAQAGNTPSPFGATTQPSNASPFGGNAQTNNTSPFGGAAANAQSGGGFGTNNAGNQSTTTSQQANPFGQAQQPAQSSSPFGQPQQSNQNQGSFGQPHNQPQTQNSNPFAQPQQASPFGKATQAQNPSPFDQKQPQASPFGLQQPANPSPFGQGVQAGFGTQSSSNLSNPFSSNSGQSSDQTSVVQNGTQPTVQASKPTNNPVRPLHYTQSLQTGPSQNGPDGKLARYRNMPVDIKTTTRPTAYGEEVPDMDYLRYNRPDRKGLERIWFPNGLQDATVQRLARVTLDFQDANDAYDEKVKEQYAYLFENGSFKNHVIPLVPPERGWIDYDF